MKAADTIKLIESIGLELQGRYTFNDVRDFLRHHGIDASENFSVNSKRLYTKEQLRNAPIETILAIATELDLPLPSGAGYAKLPQIWSDTTDLRLFISHISKHKDKATRLKTCLAPFAINAFVAHEDMLPTLEWQQEIERALFAMDAFLAIHTPGFSQSNWTQQEIGFAVSRGLKIISLKMGEDPTGFISKRQALARRDRTAEQIAIEIDTMLAADELTRVKLEAARKAKGLIPEDCEIPF
jgi:hypothetical protein